MIDLDEDEKTHLAANIAWLAAADPDDWHRVALDFNWSETLYLLDWIVRQDNCDAATALTIFWNDEPTCWLDEDGASDEEPNGYSYLNARICAYVANRVRTGGYTRSEIAFAAPTWKKKDYVDLVEAEAALTNPNFRAHPDLIRDRAGRDVDLNADFYRRYPEQFHLSHFDQQLSDDLEAGRYFTPETAASWEKVQEIERATLETLPEWLRDQPSSQQVTAAPAEPWPQAVADDAATDASARIRALRRAAEHVEAPAATATTTGLADWLKRLLGR